MKFGYLKSINAEYIDELFAQYQTDPESVDESWRYFFDGLDLGSEIPPHAISNGHVTTKSPADGVDLVGEAKVAELIAAYREGGHVLANLNPLKTPRTEHPLLALATFGLSPSDLNKTFQAGKLIGLGATTLQEIVKRLKEVYSSTYAIEYTHMQDSDARTWLQTELENIRNRAQISPETQKFILKRITESTYFENFLHTRYVAQKRFSLEGGESLIALLDRIFEAGGEAGATHFVMGMAHRGRLNVLANVFGKKPEFILTEFEDNYAKDTSMGEGDVKYHKGYSSDVVTQNGHAIHLSLAYNPSHLEFVNPVVEGMARAKQEIIGDHSRQKVIPVLIHGDAAFAGQGVVFETLGFAGLPGYTTGGTVHIVIDNQVGFTADSHDTRATPYSTDLAKMLGAPIFHVNGDDPDVCCYVAKIATEYRNRFKKDVFIDLVCYRRYGHNEGDEPSFTQPILYKTIKNHPTTHQIYSKKLIDKGIVSEADVQSLITATTEKLTQAQELAKAGDLKPQGSSFESQWKGFRQGTDADIFKPVVTQVEESKLKTIATKLYQIPEQFVPHPKLTKVIESRLKSVQSGVGIDWGTGEALTYGSLVLEKHPVRLSGQDSERGTFSHRHAVLHHFETGETWVGLNQLSTDQAPFNVFNSSLSETGIMGFDYGYSLTDPNSLVIWEAQFGDFSNGAQVIIDQFIASAESKWQRSSGLVLLLPHGYEGQGPEHSSARLERFLQLCGRNNMAVCNLTTPAQFFHGLRRQLKRDFRKPLVIMSPKSLLRHPKAVSNLQDFSSGAFQEVIEDVRFPQKNTVKKVILCSGKIYYDLLSEAEKKSDKPIAIQRVEQLYPFPHEALEKIWTAYGCKEVTWVQEEPKNMGAYYHVMSQFAEHAHWPKLHYVGREIGASPAVGSHKLHAKEQQALIEKALS